MDHGGVEMKTKEIEVWFNEMSGISMIREPISLDEEMKNEYLAGGQAMSELYEAENKRLREALVKAERCIASLQSVYADCFSGQTREALPGLRAELLAALDQPATEMGET